MRRALPLLLLIATSAAAQDTVHAVRLPALSVEGAAAASRFRSSTLLDRSALSAWDGRTLVDALSAIPGLTVRSQGGAGAYATVTVRGSSPAQVVVLLDGVPLRDPLTGVADLGGIPVASLESIEVVRGADAAKSGAIGGVIRLTSRRAGGVSTAGEVGSFGHEAMSLSAGNSRWIGLTASHDQNDFSYVNPIRAGSPTESRVNADATLYSVYAGSGVGPGELTTRVDGLVRGVPGSIATTLFDSARQSLSRGQLSWQTATNHLSADMERVAYDDPRHPTSHAITYASALDGEERFNRIALVDATLSGRVESAYGDGLSARVTRGVLAGVLSRMISVRRAFIQPLLRVDWISENGLFASPQLAAGIPFRYGVLRARVGQSVRAPSFGDLHLSPQYRVVQNPDLKPERAVIDAEIGVTIHEACGTLGCIGVDAALFSRRVDDPIIWVPSSFNLYSPRNLGRLAADGAEATAEARRGGLSLSLQSTLTHSRTRVSDVWNRVPLEPRQSSRVALSWARSLVTVRSDLRRLGDRTADLSGTFTLPAVTLIDVGASFRRSSHVPFLLDLGIDNAANAAWSSLPNNPMPGRTLRVRLSWTPSPHLQ